MPYKEPADAHAHDRQRYRRLTEERVALRLCLKCGQAQSAPDHSLCQSCAEKRRKAERARYAKAKAAGKLYGGKDAERCRRIARGRSRRRDQARKAAGQCTRCGKQHPVECGAVCEPCREMRRISERVQYAKRRVAGECGRCGTPTPDGDARCDRCVRNEDKRSRKKAKNTQSRQRYSRRRARGLCTNCGEPSNGAARCPTCARRSYVRSGEHRGIPIWPPRFTVIEIATGEDHGTWDSWDEVVMCLAFARLSREQVEVISDASPMATFTSW